MDAFEKEFDLRIKYQDRIISSYYAIWSSLITINAVIIGSYSIIIVMYPQIPNWISFYAFPFSLILTLISIFLLIWNFSTFRSFYTELKNESFEMVRIVNKEEIQKEDKKIKGYSRRIKIIEFIAKFTITLNILLILITIILGKDC